MIQRIFSFHCCAKATYQASQSEVKIVQDRDVIENIKTLN